MLFDVQVVPADFALVDAKTAIDRCGLDTSHARQDDLAWLLSAVLLVEDVVPALAGATWCSDVQGIEASDVVLWRRRRNLHLPRKRRKIFSLRIGRRHGEHLLYPLNALCFEDNIMGGGM